MNLLNGARWLSGAFTGILNWIPTTARTINLPDDSGTILLDDRPIGSIGSGVSLRGYEPLVTITANKTLALTDAGTVQNCTNGSTATITIPLNSAVAFPIGTRIIIRKTTSQTVTIVATGGVTVLNESGTNATLLTVASNSIIRKTGTDTWILDHDIQNNANLPGDPTTTTQSVGNISTRIATTAFVDTAFNTVNNISRIRYLFVIAGESNAGGTALNSLLTADQLLPQNHVKIWNNTTSTFQSLQIGNNNLIDHVTLTNNVTHGIERGLSRELLNTLQLPDSYILKSGQGGSTIAQWSVGNATGYLTTLTNRFNAARTALTSQGFTVRPIFIWLNGINDAVSGTVPATFRTATQAHFTQIRSLMGASTPIFMPQIMPTNAAYTAINTEIATIDTADTNMWALSTVDVPNNPADPNNYTANGYLQIARSFVDSFRNNLGMVGSFSIGQSRAVSSNPIVSLKRSTAFTIPHNTQTLVPLNLVEVDTDNMFNSSAGTVVIPRGGEGVYQVSASVTMGAVQLVQVQIYINGVMRAQSPIVSLTLDNSFGGEITRIFRLNVGDIVSLQTLQVNSGSGSRNLYLQPEFQTSLQMVRIGA